MTSNGRQPPMEDDLQWKTTSNGRRPPLEVDIQCKTPSMEGGLQWNLEENSEDISSVALLSPACYYLKLSTHKKIIKYYPMSGA